MEHLSRGWSWGHQWPNAAGTRESPSACSPVLSLQGFISSSIFSFFFLIPSFHPLSYFTPFSLCYRLMAFSSLWWPKRKLVVMQGPNTAL